jgi:hypothetical protein
MEVCGIGREENRFPDLHLHSIVLINSTPESHRLNTNEYLFEQ